MRPERLLKEDLELLEGRSSKVLLQSDSSSEVPMIRRRSEVESRGSGLSFLSDRAG